MTVSRPERIFSLGFLATLIAAGLSACSGGGPATQVDLALHDASLTTPAVPQGSAVSVSFAITNESTLASSAFVVRAAVTLEAGGAVTILADFPLTPLAAGASSVANHTVTLPGAVAPGVYWLSLEIDPDGVASLGNRGDDHAEFRLTVTEPVRSCTEPDEVVSFADPAITAFVEARLASIGDGSMTCANVAQIQQLNVTNKGVTSLAGVEHLTGVYRSSLYENAITDLSPMAGMTALRELSIFDNQITSLAPLADLPLERLSVGQNLVSDLGPVASLSGLISLTIEANLVTSLAPLAEHPSLEYLRAYDNQIGSLAPLANVVTLKHVDVYGNAYTSVPDLSGMTALTYLRVGGSDLVSIAGVSGLEVIEELAVVRSSVVDISPIAGLGTLTRLILADNLIEDITPLDALTGIEHLNLDDNRLTAMTAVATMTGLDDLSVNRNKLTDLAPVVANLGIASGDWLRITGNCIANNDMDVLVPPQTQHLMEIQARGVLVQWTPGGSDAWCGR
jgi:Leucine-rich repeat (LRR) protein